MEPGIYSLVLLPLGLGLIGFVEPCTVGAHLIVLRTLADSTRAQRIAALATFVAARALTTGAIGAAAAAAGTLLIAAQTTMWLVFGAAYLALGAALLFGPPGLLTRAVDLAPVVLRGSRRASSSPVLMGIAFGLNIPACAAPILFALIGVAAGTGSAAAGFVSMALFGFALSLPLVPVALHRRSAALLDRMRLDRKRSRRILAAVFLVLGAWSVWFGLFVDPRDWSGL